MGVTNHLLTEMILQVTHINTIHSNDFPASPWSFDKVHCKNSTPESGRNGGKRNATKCAKTLGSNKRQGKTMLKLLGVSCSKPLTIDYLPTCIYATEVMKTMCVACLTEKNLHSPTFHTHPPLKKVKKKKQSESIPKKRSILTLRSHRPGVIRKDNG